MTLRKGLLLPADLTWESWQGLGQRLSSVNDASRWWLGDWLVYGRRQFPGLYTRALEATSLEYQTLRNYAWVARSIPLSRRRDGLSFHHHAEVAALGEVEQSHWLDRACSQAWSRKQLRDAVRADRGRPAIEPTEGNSAVRIELEVTQVNKRAWEDAALELRMSLAAWIALVLNGAIVDQNPMGAEE